MIPSSTSPKLLLVGLDVHAESISVALADPSGDVRHYGTIPACVSPTIRFRHHGQPKAVTDLSWKAQIRLCARYRSLVVRHKKSVVAVTAVARELAGFVRAMAHLVESETAPRRTLVMLLTNARISAGSTVVIESPFPIHDSVHAHSAPLLRAQDSPRMVHAHLTNLKPYQRNWSATQDPDAQPGSRRLSGVGSTTWSPRVTRTA